LKTKVINIIVSIFIFLISNPIFAQRTDDSSGASDPGLDPDAAPIDDYIWVLALFGLIYGIIKLKSYTKNKAIRQ
jgi:hypothetical protein